MYANDIVLLAKDEMKRIQNQFHDHPLTPV